MKLKISRTLLLVCSVALFCTATISCKKKTSDADIKTAIETVLKTNATTGEKFVTVTDGVATITGECKDQACIENCQKLVAAVKGVKSVVNNTIISPAYTPPVITADDPLTSAVTDALKSFPGVTATVKDGIVSLTGKISKLDRQKLMMALQALKPKKVEVGGLTNN